MINDLLDDIEKSYVLNCMWLEAAQDTGQRAPMYVEVVTINNAKRTLFKL